MVTIGLGITLSLAIYIIAELRRELNTTKYWLDIERFNSKVR
jgi:hypothetical protein